MKSLHIAHLHALSLLAVMLPVLLLSCSSRPKNVTLANTQPDIYPDYIGVTVPVEIAPLCFTFKDDAFTTIDVEVRGTRGQSIHANGRYADFDIDEWHQLLKQNQGGILTFTVYGEKDGKWTQFKDFSVFVSAFPLGQWGITYRRIAPSYELYSNMGIYQRDLSSFDESAILENTQSTGMCINCHTSNRTNPDQFVFHIRGEHGATYIHRNGSDELLQAKNETLGGSMVYPCWHPRGRYCAFSTNKTSQMFHAANNKRIEVYDASSDVFVYDAQTHRVLNDTLIMKKYWAENCPAFSPDGRWLYFITARRQVYPTHYDKERYNLCRVSFDEKTGKIGTQVDTLLCADAEGKSISWPQPSYDGKFLMYTKADYGYFTVWHPESDLWLLDLTTGETHPLNEVNSDRAESLHRWSLNSRWFLFTSRRENGLYTRLYFASIDEKGKSTKPFLLPQRDPKNYYRRLLHSYNTPDFASRPVNLNAREVGRLIDSDKRVTTK